MTLASSLWLLVNSTLHHPLALENLLLHGFELCIHASSTPWSLHIADMQHPLTHLNGLRVLQHLREIGVDKPFEKLVLGSAWRRHDALDLFFFEVWNVLESVPYVFLRGYGLNNISFNIDRVT